MPSAAHTWPGHFWALGLSGSRGCLGDSDAHSPGPRASLHAGRLGAVCMWASACGHQWALSQEVARAAC